MRLKREAFGECIAEVAAKAGVDEDAAFDLIQTVANHGDKLRASGEVNPFDAAAADLAQKAKDSAAQNRADALRNATIRAQIIQRVRDSGGLANAELTLRSILHGTNRGERDSVEALWRANSANWTAVLSNKLRQLGLEKVAISGKLDKEISEALWSMNSGEKMGDHVSKPARDIAAAIKPLMDLTKDRLNGAGARIGDAMDYVARTSHDPVAMRAAAGAGKSFGDAFQAWWGFARPRLSEKTFADLEPVEGASLEATRMRFGRSVYEALVSGVHKTMGGVNGIGDASEARVSPAFEGTYNVARKVSQPRVLFWKDGAAWQEYMARFGSPKSVSDGIMRNLDASARSLAMMQKLGTNPAGNLNMIIRKIEEEYRTEDGLNKFQGKVEGLRNVMGRLDGSLNVPANEMWANISGNVRTWESMTMLGGVGITHATSALSTIPSELVHHGVPRLSALGGMVKAILTGKGTAERQEILADLGAYASGLNREVQNRWQADDPIPGHVASIANTYMKYTGIHYLLDNFQAGIREMLAHQLGRSTDTAFDGLNLRLQKMLGKYGVQAPDWELLRKVADLPTSEGRAYMTPNMATRTDPAAVEGLLRSRGEISADAGPVAIDRAVRDYQWHMADNLGSYYSDAAAHGIVTPGVRERAMVLGNTQPGSFNGELARYISQFKMWPLAAVNQMLGREIYLATSKGDAAFNIGVMIATSMVGGYLRMVINDAARGNPQRDPLRPQTMIAALAQGGGVGILGDFLFGETNRMGGGVLTTAVGPVATDANALGNIFLRFRQDATDSDPDVRAKALDHAWPDLMRFGIAHVPFANLVYLKGALDYMLFYHMFEAASPGWYDRSNERLQRETGRTMIGYTPGAGVPYGIPGLYLGGNAAPPTGALAGQPPQ